jgi:hypothetical protein
VRRADASEKERNYLLVLDLEHSTTIFRCTVTPYKYLRDMTKTKPKIFEKILVLATMKK